MSIPEEERRRGRRAFLTRAATVAAMAGSGAAAGIGPRATAAIQVRDEAESFWGVHQAGIATPPQRQVYFAAFDLTATKRDEVADLLRAWTAAAARLTTGHTAEPLPEQQGVAPDAGSAAPDSGEALGLSPARLTVTFGFGAGLFSKDGNDRYGLGSRRPEALVDLPRFPGDQMVADHTGGDLSIQACADDPQVAFHAVRQLARIAGVAAQLRWVQSGFLPASGAGQTPRNLMGFKDGTNNVSCSDSQGLARFVWVGGEGPDWMRGGSYLVARRIRIALEHWDRMKLAFQEQTVGRHKDSGAPLGKGSEFAPVDLQAADQDGNPVIPENAHVRLAAAATNDGAQILRRGYSYNDGVNFTAERWPPWRQGMEYDAGLFFLAYQRDPRTGFIRLFEKMSRFDMLNQFVTHVGGGLFACPAGAQQGRFIGQGLFESA
jgi:deferrochelatase/peroxidase EfeB